MLGAVVPGQGVEAQLSCTWVGGTWPGQGQPSKWGAPLRLAIAGRQMPGAVTAGQGREEGATQ
eukprot:8429298-Alexandrium_andersonii.AAC.1